MKPFTKRVVNIICAIPKGKVMTYGQIAKIAGSPRAARQVVRVLHTLSEKYQLPWHRVLNSKGCIGLTGEHGQLQRRILEEEGMIFQQNGSINLIEYGYEPLHLIEEME
ncbi:DNA base-flipping protein [Bacillus sp. T2.9-1]|uniref:MGMT family protein n=1 Tax=Bacillus sp. T2.9-1 TaxID=3041163 RepID=UPI002477595C|nr:MGMT family protein [Bacillus sp. T2.9-1]CAI9396210.1 DNA base-flipping protein [Bacillus sp. T2.9-1]